MAEKKTETGEQPPATDAADLAAHTATVLADERKRVAAIEAALPGDAFSAIRQKATFDGLDVAGAKALGFDAAREQLAAATAELTTLKASIGRAGIKAGAIKADEPSDAEGQDEEAKRAAEKDPEKAAAVAYEARVDELVASGKSRGQAYNLATKELPEGHAAWVKLGQPG